VNRRATRLVHNAMRRRNRPIVIAKARPPRLGDSRLDGARPGDAWTSPPIEEIPHARSPYATLIGGALIAYVAPLLPLVYMRCLSTMVEWRASFVAGAGAVAAAIAITLAVVRLARWVRRGRVPASLRDRVPSEYWIGFATTVALALGALSAYELMYWRPFWD
jgi:hypothetical protein